VWISTDLFETFAEPFYNLVLGGGETSAPAVLGYSTLEDWCYLNNPGNFYY